jgi:hypothetical protein
LGLTMQEGPQSNDVPPERNPTPGLDRKNLARALASRPSVRPRSRQALPLVSQRMP